MYKTIIHGDSLEEMKKIPDASIDAVITDPPYFMMAHYISQGDGGKKRRRWSDASILQAWWKQLCNEFERLLKPSGHVIVFCNADSYPAFFIPMYERFTTINCLVWDKTTPGLGTMWRRQHEMIIAARHSKSYRPPPKCSKPDILKHKIVPAKRRRHPVEKPVELLKELVEHATPEGGTVLDPFAGGGSCLMAADELKRSYIGIEMEEDYIDIIRERLPDAKTSL
ncbi:site-specific DNA-methyltransferase [Hazenella sp. IB182357]|uniref:Methyltransferase n=1 Tax=Polycladospora coralii TaxID=2771432 RepID=A0A926RUA2_9BACL|nr:site-specific DNA-methyltransferase [Polycladospora coralii]MBD1373725.1 site-specific DNA-methyltransferase [Polycladospora coralii]